MISPMKKVPALCGLFALSFLLAACGQTEETAVTDAEQIVTEAEQVETDTEQDGTGAEQVGTETTDESLPPESEEEQMKIQVTDGTHTVVFALNGSPAAQSLYHQLPLTVDVENYSDNEKIFYPEKLDTDKAVNADAKKGTLAYFSPWGDVVMYYKDFGSYRGLYELGQAFSGSDEIESLSGTIDVTAVE